MGVREDFGVYVHIPFCRRRCDYCAFATWVGREAIWERYIDACTREVGARLQSRRRATSVFFGGGTPSLIPADLLVGVLSAIEGAAGLARDAEVTVECNPETVTASKLRAYREAGVTRLSFGAQSMVPHVLASLGREHQASMVTRAADLAGEAGFAGAYGVDLIFGAAGESLADWEATLVGALSLSPRPAHVSAYALTVEAGTPLSKDRARYPDDDDQAEKYTLADALLQSEGYEWYEISNWARPGAECAHNRLYWSQGEYAGIGCSAHSHALVDSGSPVGAGGGDEPSARRWWNVRTPERYCALVEAGRTAEAAGEVLGPIERAAEALMLAVRTREGVPSGAVPAELFDEGLVARRQGSATTGQTTTEAATEAGGGRAGEGERAVLTLRGRLLANEVALRLASVPARGGV
jgi:oxygen-independent coproporphyrinogen-3 oxidase